MQGGEFADTALDEDLLCFFHRQLFGGVRSHAGRCRGPGFGSDTLTFGPNRSSPKEQVPEELEALFEELSRSVTSFESDPQNPTYEASAVHVAVWAHAGVIKIHPFEDGNGRSSRLLLDAILVRLGIRPVAFEIPKEEYRRALNHYFGSGDIQALVDLALRAYRFLHLR